MEEENVLVMTEANNNSNFNNNINNRNCDFDNNNTITNNDENDDDDDDDTKNKLKSVNKEFGVEVIPFSEYNYREDDQGYSPYGSSEISDYSNTSLATTQDSSGSTLCVNNKVNPLDDPIIQEMFKQRTVEMDKVEEERRIRMYTMMRYSKKYKHMLIERANIQWDKNNNKDKDDDEIDGSVTDASNSEENLYNNNNNNEESNKMPNWFENDQMKNPKKLSQKTYSSNFGIDLHDLDLIDMELNNNSHNTDSDDDITRSSSQDNNSEEIDYNSSITTTTNGNKGEIKYNSILKSNSKNSSSSSERTNEGEIKYNSILKSNSKNSSSSGSERANGELLKSHYKYSSILVNNNNSNDNNNNLMNKNESFYSNHNKKINNFINSASKKQISFVLTNSDEDNKVPYYPVNCFNSEINNTQAKNMKKHKKLKLFRLGHNRKIKNKIEIDDTSTFKQVNFNSKNSIESTSDSSIKVFSHSSSKINSSFSLSSQSKNSSISLGSSMNDDRSNSSSSTKTNEKKKKYYGFIKFFLNKKHSKSNNEPPPEQISKSSLNSNDYNKNIMNSKVDTFKKTKSIRFSDSVNIIP